MLRFRHYGDSDSLGSKYLFGLNIYRNPLGLPEIDVIVGKHVFVAVWDSRK